MKVVEIQDRYFVYGGKDRPVNTFAIVNDYTLLDSNLEFLEKVKERVAQLGSITTVEEIEKEGGYYKLMFTTSVLEKDVKQEICNVYTKYRKSDKPLTYPFHDEVVNTPNPNSLTREHTNHFVSILTLLKPLKEITDNSCSRELSLVPPSDSSDLTKHPLANAMRKMVISDRFFRQMKEGSLCDYNEETQHRHDGKWTVIKKDHRGYQFDEEGNIDDYCSDDEGLSYK